MTSHALRGLWMDVGAAHRTLIAARGFTAIAVATLGTGIALCVTVLTVMNAYLVRSLPYPAADRLYRLDLAAPGQNPPDGLATLDWRALDNVLESQISWDLDVFYVLADGSTRSADGGSPELTPGAWVTPGYITGLGVQTAIGRVFDAADYETGRPLAAIISHRLWQTRFGGDPAIVGQTFRAFVSDRPDEAELLTIIGVLPVNHWHVNSYTDVLAPLRAPSYPYMVRLRDRVSAAAAADRIATFIRTSLPALPPEWRPILTQQQAFYVASLRPTLWTVSAAAALVLIIAGANVAVLLLVRGRRRGKEMAVRLALGASPVRLLRLLAVEGLVLGVAATVVGVLVSRGAMRAIAPLVERVLERRVPGGLDAFDLEWPPLLAVAAVALAVTLVFTVVPLLVNRRPQLAATLGAVSRGSTEAAASGRTRAVLIALEIAASLTLVTGAALMVQTATTMLRVDFGVQADDVGTASLSLRERSYPDAVSRVQFYDRLLSSLQGTGGAHSVALGNWWPLQGSRPRHVEASGPSPAVSQASLFSATDDYFATLGIAMRDGRSFAPEDRLGTEPVAVVSESLARQLWPSDRAVDQRMTIRLDADSPPVPHLVIGVVSDVRQMHTDTDLKDVYLAFAQRADRFAFMYLRSPRASSWRSDLRAAVAAIDREVAVGTPRWLSLGFDDERTRPEFVASLLAVFAGFASVLALVGMHGVIAYAVGQREREIAIRMAVGADPRAIVTLFLRQGSPVLLAGLSAGVAGAMALGGVLRSQLFGVAANDPTVLAGATGAFAACALAAMWWPAARAAALDPARVLNRE